MREQVGALLNQTLTELWGRVVAFAPNLLAMLLILAAGIVVAVGIHVGVRLALSALRGDDLASRLGISTVLRRAGLTRSPSTLIAQVLASTAFAVFVIMAIGALDVEIASGLLARALAFLPQIVIALAVLVLGGLVAAFVHRTVLIAAVNAGVPSARFLAAAAHTAVIALAAAMALEQIGVGRQVIITAFGVVFGGVVFALALALGLGGRDLARDALERLFRRQPPDNADDPRRHV